MISKRSVLSLFFCGVVIFSLFGMGCKKEAAIKEVKEGKSVAEPASNLFKAQITADSVPQSAKAGATINIPVKVKNLSDSTWPAKTANPVRLAYHWFDKAGNKVVWDSNRSILPKDLPPGQEIPLTVKVEMQKKKGEYVLEIDMVQEKVAWFKNKGSQTLRFDMVVK